MTSEGQTTASGIKYRCRNNMFTFTLYNKAVTHSLYTTRLSLIQFCDSVQPLNTSLVSLNQIVVFSINVDLFDEKNQKPVADILIHIRSK